MCRYNLDFKTSSMTEDSWEILISVMNLQEVDDGGK